MKRTRPTGGEDVSPSDERKAGKERPGIPFLPRILLHLILPPRDREFFLGDMEEQPRSSWLREILGALAFRCTPGHRTDTGGTEGHPPRKATTMLTELFSDLRFALRMMARSPGFTVVAILTMALGIGANTAMFSIVNGVIFRPLPYPEAHRVMLLSERNLSRGWSSFSIAPLNLWDWQEQNRSMELMAAYQRGSVNYNGGDRPQALTVYAVTEDFLEILGGEPSRGRGINREDLNPDGPAVAVLTHGFWLREFAGDPEVLGRTMVLDGVPHTIVGIIPEGWRPFSRSQTHLVFPMRPQPFWYSNRGSHFLHGLGRLKPGVTVEQAQADFSTIALSLEAEYPDSNTGWDALVRPLREVVLGSTRPQLLILLASVGLVLLIACANLANMTLARTTVRSRELAIRTAVGAGRGRVVRQPLAESVLLATLGGAAGVGLAYLALDAFVAGWPTILPRMQEIRMDTAVLLYSLGLSVGAGVLFGLVPAMTVARQSLNESIRQGARSLAGDGAGGWLRRGLVVAEVALAVILLVSTGLLLRSFDNLQAQDPGFQTENRLVFATPLPRARYDDAEKRVVFADEVLARLAAIPGVESAALTNMIPLEGSDEIWGFWKAANAVPGANEDASALCYRITPGYFQAMGIPILVGRGIEGQDRSPEHPVVVVSASLAKEHYGDENPVGQFIKFGRDADDPLVEIVGVVGDVMHYQLGQSSIPQVYLPFHQRVTGNVSFVLKASLPPMVLAENVRDAIADVDQDQPVLGLQEAGTLINDAVSMPRFRTLLMSGFGLTALILAVVGLYGVVAYGVSQRTREFGVRMALGASRASVLGLIFRDGGPLVALGFTVGCIGALLLSRVLEAMLFGVGARDPVVFLVVPLVLALVAATALAFPAQRATRVDPVEALGGE